VPQRRDRIARMLAAVAPPRPVLPAWLDRLGGYGVVTRDPKIARRQRFTTFVCYASAANALSHLVINLGYALWPLWPVHLYNALFAALVLLVPLTHRFGDHAAATLLVTMIAGGNLFVVFALGSDSDLHVYFTLIGGVIFMYGVENWRAWGGWFLVGVAEIVIAVHVAPHHGLLPAADEPLRHMLAGHAMLNAATINLLLVFVALTQLSRAEKRLEEANHRSDALIGAMLPAPIAERLKAAPDAPIAERIDGLAVLFADLVGFTEAAHEASPEEVVGFLDELYRRFDDITARHGAEKIKTIGDCYLAIATGGGDARAAAHTLARVALALRAAFSEAPPLGGVRLALRVGLHSGPAIAGVIGTTRFTYDVWGDAVNTASRMESSARPGEIQASLAFAALVEDGFGLAPRGPFEVKGLGSVETRLVTAEHGGGERAIINATQHDAIPPPPHLV
jgi:adenylate cyclase